MKLEKAMNWLLAMLGDYEGGEFPNQEAAIKLGIEALKREQILRHEIPYDRDGLLPGETEE